MCDHSFEHVIRVGVYGKRGALSLFHTAYVRFETPTLFTIAADLTQMQVVADVDEADIGGVKDGQRVTFSVDAYPNDTFEGVVTQIRLGEDSSTSSGSSGTSGTVVTYEVVISAPNPGLKLKPRLTAFRHVRSASHPKSRLSARMTL